MTGSTLAFGCALLFGGAALAAQPVRVGDQWVSEPVQYPQQALVRETTSSVFSNLQALVQGGHLTVFWTNGAIGTNTAVQVHASADDPGHWPARDWRVYSMSWRSSQWEFSLPVVDLDVPIAYFVSAPAARAEDPRIFSPIRMCRPRALGLAAPTALFWPFLEGFEQGLENWRLLGAPSNAPPLAVDSLAKDGLRALQVSLPPGRRSVTVATTQIRGWHFRLRGATGVRLWMRTRSDLGYARFTFFSEALTTNQVMAACRATVKLKDEWQKVSLFLGDFPNLSTAGVDLFAIEFVSERAQDFLVDNLELLGPWRQEAE